MFPPKGQTLMPALAMLILEPDTIIGHGRRSACVTTADSYAIAPITYHQFVSKGTEGYLHVPNQIPSPFAFPALDGPVVVTNVAIYWV